MKNCPSCGAPIVSEICAYCGTPTGLDPARVTMEYPVLECREASVTFWTLWFPLIFAAAFGIPGLIVLAIAAAGHGMGTMFLVGVPFVLIGVTALCLALRTVKRHAKVKARGETIYATVYGYMDDNLLINGRPAQIVKLLAQTPDGPRFILYQLRDTIKQYRIHDRLQLMVYQNYFSICENKSTPWQ